MDKVLISSHVTPKFDPEAITYILDHMRPSQCNLYLSSKSVESEANQEEKWYGTKFHKAKFTEQLLQKMENPEVCDDLGLPPQNKFIPDTTELKSDVD